MILDFVVFLQVSGCIEDFLVMLHIEPVEALVPIVCEFESYWGGNGILVPAYLNIIFHLST